jgi:agmatine/peptidylarginine deiminase
VDDLASFADHYTVVIAGEANKQDDNYEPLKENLALHCMTQQEPA